MEGSDKFSQSYDHYRILCKLASGHALTCLGLLVSVVSVVLFRLVPMISFRSLVCSFRLLRTFSGFISFVVSGPNIPRRQQIKVDRLQIIVVSARCLGSISPCLTHESHRVKQLKLLVVLAGNSVKTKIP